MEINKQELQTMFREFLALNNPLCEAMAVIFLRRIGLSDKIILFWLSQQGVDEIPKITKEDKKQYDDTLSDTREYYNKEEYSY